jgi:hypothetical protein
VTCSATTDDRTGGHPRLGPCDAAAAAILVLFVAGLGFALHLTFSREIGEVAFFKGAYDEDTYFLFMLRGVFDTYRTLSHETLRVLHTLTGQSTDLTLILADLVFPACSAAAAYFLASHVVRSWPARSLLSLGLIFGPDFLTLANASIWSSGRLSLASFRRWFGLWGSTMVPYPDVSFLTIFRTPEPQVSYAVVFTLLALLVRMSRAEGPGPSRRLLVTAAGLTASLPFVYIVVSLPALAIGAWLAAVLWFTGSRRVSGWLAAIVGGTALIFAVTFWMSRSRSGVFTSRWPIVTPAILVVLITVVPLTVLVARRYRGVRSAWLGLGFLVVPVVLGNQQLVTGIMVSARDWERNINYQFLLLGLVLSLHPIVANRDARATRALRSVAVLATLWIAFEVVRAQTVTYRLWLPQNLAGVAMKRAVAAAGSALPATTRLLLEPPQLAPQLRVRTGDRFACVLDFTGLFLRPVPPLDARGGIPASPYADDLFEHWWRTGTTPAEAESVLRAEASERSGYFLGFLFNVQDYWYPGTDNRKVRQTDILGTIPQIIARYRACERCDGLAAQDVGFLTSQAPAAVRSPAGLTNRLLSTGRAGDVRFYLYHQGRIAP